MFIKSRNCFEKKTKCSKTKQVVLEQIKMFYKKYHLNIVKCGLVLKILPKKCNGAIRT